MNTVQHTHALDFFGDQMGSVSVRRDSSGTVIGTISGSLHVSSGVIVVIREAQRGSVHVDRGSIIRVEQGGKLAGSMHVDGLVENRGTRGCPVCGSGDIRDLDGGREMVPRVVGGANIYEV